MTGETQASETLPLVSILVPAYNHERFVLRCLDSVLEDAYPAKELVVIDDGSVDGTAAKIAGWIARHEGALPITFRQRENRGVAATLNELASLARGDFLRLGASDDFLLPGGTQLLVRYLQAHPGKSAAIGDSIVVDRYGNRLHGSGMRELHGADKRLYATDEGIRRAVIAQWAIGGPVALLRRHAPAQIAGWTEQLRIDDWDFFLRLAARDALGFVDAPVCAYRLHDANLSKTRHVATRIANLTESRRVAERRLELFEGPDRLLLKAQAHYIGAKVAYLRRHPLRLGLHLLTCMALRGMSKLRHLSPHPVARRA
ncbi:glycosyltransferase family 2 protein [Dyella sp. BiH032]|uniref:glycosyltransferase family 2 protein n=1 Tax=Dyella sp. BiH032 TaxID=3075430 RepID=UPI0028930386|nr:glycosyltransferase family 2 protein [Dyella sp. BiH032]WNL44368.1 glycosyltransferase family 2 protein [Dyella sp. BiH032]